MSLYCPECRLEMRELRRKKDWIYCLNGTCKQYLNFQWALGVAINNLVWEIKIAARDTWKKREDTKTYYYLITAAMYSLRKTSNVLYKLIYNYELIRRKKTRDLWWFFSWQSLRIKYYRRGLRYYTGEYPRRSNN